MKSIYLLILTFLSLNIYSQSENNIIVKYKVFASDGSIENTEMARKSKSPGLYNGVDNALISLEYELVATKTKSHFYKKEGIATNEKATRIALIIAGRDEFYINKKDTSYVKYRKDGAENFYISYRPQANWSLTNESKKIEGFLCYKATIEKTIPQKDKKFKTYTVIAWYCPEIPFSFGPKEFGDLPGLILELQDSKATFLASKIDMNVVKLNNLDLNPKEKVINESEYIKIVEEKTKELFDKLDKYNEKK